jgi:hypothetical protein
MALPRIGYLAGGGRDAVQERNAEPLGEGGRDDAAARPVGSGHSDQPQAGTILIAGGLGGHVLISSFMR